MHIKVPQRVNQPLALYRLRACPDPSAGRKEERSWIVEMGNQWGSNDGWKLVPERR